MTDHKYTDEELVSKLEKMTTGGHCCDDCSYADLPHPGCKQLIMDQAYDLINRQREDYLRLEKAYIKSQEIFADQCLENERLKVKIKELKDIIAAYEDAARESREEHVKQQAIIDEILTILRGGQPNDPPSMPAGLPSEIG